MEGDEEPKPERELVMCGGCTGSGKVPVPGQRHQLTPCPACGGEGIR